MPSARLTASRMRENGDRARDARGWAEAARWYRAYLEKKPQDFGILVQLGHALKEQGLVVDALQAYSSAYALNPFDADILLQLGHLHKRMGHRIQAITFYRRSADLDGNLHAVDELRALGERIERGDHLSTITGPALQGRELSTPGGGERLRGLGLFLTRLTHGQSIREGDAARAVRDWPAAAKHYGLHVTLHPRDFDIWVQYGHALKESGRLEDASRAYAAAAALDPRNADLMLNWGHLSKLMGRTAEAMSFYRDSFAIDGNPHAALELQNLELIETPLPRPAEPRPRPGTAERPSPPPLFDARYYLESNPDVVELGHDPWLHYRDFGGQEGRSPGPLFDGKGYLDANPDVREAGLNPLLHYLEHGAAEGRPLNPEAFTPSHEKFGYIALPLNYPQRTPWPFPRLAVLLHAYYLDTLPTIIGSLRNIPFPFALHISTDTRDKKLAIQNIISDEIYSDLNIIVVENRGRDIAPRLIDFRDTYVRYDFVLHIHTKKSIHDERLGDWLANMLDDLIKTPETVRSIFEIFDSDPRVGIIAPRIHPVVQPFVRWDENLRHCSALAHRLGVQFSPAMPCAFPAGSIFWARAAALRPLIDLNLRREDFELEAGQTDGTLAHALERMIFLSAEIAGYGWLFVGNSVGLKLEADPAALNGRDELRAKLAAFSARSRLITPEPGGHLTGAADRSAPREVVAKLRHRSACRARLDAFLGGRERIVLNTSATPVVSVILVLFNGAELTFELLQSLRFGLGTPTEIIVIDNNSTDRTRELLERVDGLRTVLNAENLHFLRAVNQAAPLTLGTYVLLLNNDTTLPPEAITRAVGVLDTDGMIGAVGGKLILPDETLQEAGSIIWSDGSCVGYGRGANPLRAEFEFRRDVDYCSGAFLMIRRALFEQLGWLDERYAPAYYEETDLCLRVRQAGFRVVYDPLIEVRHFEFGSSSSSQQALDLQARNYKIFRERHGDFLARTALPPGGSLLEARSVSTAPRILVIDDRVPYAFLGAGYPRAQDLLLAIHKEGWQICFYPLIYPDNNFSVSRKHFPIDIEIAADLGVQGLASFLRERTGHYDAVLISRPHNMAKFNDACLSAPEFLTSTHVIYDAEALFVEREVLRRRLFEKPMSASEYQAALSLEVAIARHANAIVSVGAKEAATFARTATVPVHVLGHSLSCAPTPTPFDRRRDILFVGALNGLRETAPNVDSVLWFVEEVMPRLDAEIGSDWRFKVAGRVENEDIRKLESDRIVLLGIVPDLTDLYGQCRLFVAPTRFAAGLPFKVQQAAAHGLPCVITCLLASQLAMENGKDVLAADGAAEFATACARLYGDRSLWETVRSHGLVRIGEDCAPEAFVTKLRSVITDAPLRPRRVRLVATPAEAA